MAFEISDQRESIYLDLESSADQTKLNDPELYLSQHWDKLVILDEVHRLLSRAGYSSIWSSHSC
ncbi:MAG: hypothetical protein WD555_05210 [Fulvivirga sp.]